jgi:DNA-binding SARP family transcriptional activator
VEAEKGRLPTTLLRLLPSSLRLLISTPRLEAASGQLWKPPYDGRAVNAAQPAPAFVELRRTMLVIGLSALAIAAVAVASFLLGPGLGLGIRTTYGNGIDSGLGNQVVRDFVADQDAEAAAISKGDVSLLSDRLTGNALQDVIQQINDISSAGPRTTVTMQADTLMVLHAQDPADPSLVIEVQEEGTKTVTTSSGPDSVPSQQAVSFHGDFWLRLTSGHYAIADQHLQAQPASALPAIALTVVGLVWVGLAVILVARTHPGARFVPALARATRANPELTEEPELLSAEVTPGPPPKVVVRTFGGLQVLEDGKDWAQALNTRPVTGFVWRRLLVSAIRDPSARPSRDEISRQASPGLDRETQLKRLRNLIYQGLRELPKALRERIVVEPQAMGFDLMECQVDAIDLLHLTDECAGRNLLTLRQVARAERVLGACSGTFLPEFETVEDLATDHHPTCSEMVQDLRRLLIAKRLELTLLLADTHLSNRRAGRAIALLEPAYQERPVRTDVAERLAAAYRAAGREGDARGLAARNR